MEEKGSEDEDYDESSTSILEPQEEREQEIQAPPNKKKKLKPSQDMPAYVQQALRQLNQPNDDEQVFGDFCASELRQIKNPANKRIFKKIVMEAITNVAEAEALGVIYKPSSRSFNINYSLPTTLTSPSPGSSDCSSSFPAQYNMQPNTQQIVQQEQSGHQSSILQLSGYNDMNYESYN